MRHSKLAGVPWLAALSTMTATALTATTVIALFAPVPASRLPLVEWMGRGSGLATSLALVATMVLGFIATSPFSQPSLREHAARARDVVIVLVVSLGAVHLAVIAEIAWREHGASTLLAIGGAGVLATPVALVLGSRRLRDRVHPFSIETARRAAYLVFVVALIQGSIAGPGWIQAAMRGLYLVTGIAVAADGIVRTVLGKVHPPVPVRAPLGVQTGVARKPVDVVTYLRDAVRLARDESQQLSIFFVDLTALGAIEGATDPASERIRLHAHHRDFTAIDGTTLIMVRTARFAARDVQVVAEQLRQQALPPEYEGPDPTIKIGIVSYPKHGWEPKTLLRGALKKMQEAEARPLVGIASAEGVIRKVA